MCSTNVLDATVTSECGFDNNYAALDHQGRGLSGCIWHLHLLTPNAHGSIVVGIDDRMVFARNAGS